MESLDELLAELESREAFKTADSLSGSRFEAVRHHGRQMVLKYVCVDDDWIMRATGDLHCRQLTLFESGLLDRLPSSIDHATIAVAPYTTPTGHRGGAFLMENVAPFLVPSGSDRVDLEMHLRFLDHMSALHAAYWGWRDDVELFPVAHHYVILTATMAAIERERGGDDPVPPAVGAGWASMAKLWPNTAATLEQLAREPGVLVQALAATPQTLIHADWKMGNLGEHSGGRTILLDWDRCGAGPPTFDLAWYLSVNCDRLPHSKEDAIDAYRASLHAHGIDTDGWWDRQLALTLLGAFLMLGWSKTNDRAEFGWWENRLAEGVRLL